MLWPVSQLVCSGSFIFLSEKVGMSSHPMQHLAHVMRQNGLIRFIEHFAELFPTAHLKDLVVDQIGPDRADRGRRARRSSTSAPTASSVWIRTRASRTPSAAACERWGTHNGASRAFASVRANTDAEDKLAAWLGTEATLIYPSVTLANMGAIPGLVGRQDLLVVDEQAHNSIQEGAKIAKANGVRVVTFSHCDPVRPRQGARRGRRLPRRRRGHRRRLQHERRAAAAGRAERRGPEARDAVLYVDDAHGTGVIGTQGRGTVLDALGSYDNALVVGSLSKGFSCVGGFIGCTAEMKYLLKMRSNTYIFGGPVVPPYLEAVCTVCDILMSEEYDSARRPAAGATCGC